MGCVNFTRSVLSLAGKESFGDAHGVLTALRRKAEQADALQTELTKLQGDTIASQKAALIDEAIKGGVAPAKRAELETLELSALKVCLSMLPKAAPAVIPPVVDEAGPDAHGLTADQLKILKLTGMTPEKYAEHKLVMSKLINPTEEN